MADKKNVQDELRQMTDPIVNREDYRIEWFDPSKLQNADINISQYGDDSSAKNYNNPSLWWGENQKYTWENTLGSQVAYNPNATIEWLDPTYKYGQAAQMQNSAEANYIAKRNDEIASALYNAWKTSIQDVSDFLSWQEGWQYSNANERANTINAVWKRIGQIGEQNKEEEKPEANQDAIKWMEEDLNKDTSGKLYGKVTADEWDPLNGITTLEDENSIYKKRNEARLQTFKNLEAMSDESIASAIISNAMSGDWQWMRDLMQYDYAKYERVKLAEKKMRWQMAVDAITNGTENNSSVVDTNNTDVQITNHAVDNATDTVSATQLLKWVDSILSSNANANSAKELMQSIESDMATLKNRLKNLKSEANTVFKWDVPQYLVNAYIANKQQEIQNQMQILEDRYNAANTRYQQEVQQAQWEKEYELKKKSYELDYWVAHNKSTSSSSSSSSSSGGSSSGYSVAERNNNPTNMTVDFLKMMWAEAWVDYEVSEDYFINGNWNRQYYWKLIGDPIERTISILDKAVANGRTPFTVTSWSYINELWLTNEKWKNMSHDEKVEMIKKWLPYEWWSMENMAYYLNNSDWVTNPDYDLTYQWDYDTYLSGTFGTKWFHDVLDASWKTPQEFDAEAKAYKADKDAGKLITEKTWTDRFWREYDFTTYDWWKDLTTEERELVKWVLDYREDPFKITGTWVNWESQRKIRAAALKLGWEDYNAAQFERNYNLVKKWDNATQAWWELSRNATAANALRNLYKIYHNSYLQYNEPNQIVNGITNRVLDKFFSKEAIAEFNATRDVAASELAWALKGNASPTDPEMQEYKDALSINLAPKQFDAKIKSYSTELFDKLASEAKSYERLTWEKPYNIYNDFDWLEDWFGWMLWINLSDYFSDVQWFENWEKEVNRWDYSSDKNKLPWQASSWEDDFDWLDLNN